MTWERLGLTMVLQQFRPTPLEQRLLAAAVARDTLVRHQTANPGSSNIAQLILSDAAGPPLTAFHKPLDGIDQAQAVRYGHDTYSVLINESAAWFIAKVLGPPYRDIVPDVVIRSVWPSSPGAASGFGALSLGMPGQTTRPEPMQDPVYCNPAAFFDALIGQQDRHEANYRWDGAQLSLLDNGYAFAAPDPKYLRWASEFVAARHALGRTKLSPAEVAALQSLRGASELWTWLGLLLRQLDALSDRVDRMLSTQELLGPMEF